MKPREFHKIMQEFVDEDRRWRALKEGDIIYEDIARGGEMDYHKMKIDSINLEERYVVAHDVEGKHTATVHSFLTEKEFNKLHPLTS
jgi:hypothetical protein